jgi:hypothetical protein
MKNIMYRNVGRKVYGVLMDYDLSSWTKDLTGDYTKTSEQRTGTPPFMAHELLVPDTNILHLYRHDLESLFYIMLILATNYEIQKPIGQRRGRMEARGETGTLPYQKWFYEQSYGDLADFKRSFLSGAGATYDLSESFGDFNDWLKTLHESFRDGFHSKLVHQGSLGALDNRGRKRKGNAVPQFDEETLGGHVSYSKFINSARELGGQLKRLLIRYEGRV